MEVGEFDLGSFGDLAKFSLSDSTPSSSFGGGYNLGPASQTGFDFKAPDVAPPSGFDALVQGAGDVGRGVGSAVQGTLQPISDIAKPLLPVAGLATAGMGIASGIQGSRQAAAQNRLARQGQQMQQQSAAATQAAAAPLTQFGQQELQAAQQGNIPPAIQAQIQQWKQGAIAAANDYMARSGQGNSQAREQWLAYIEQQAKAMEAAYLQDEQKLGIQGLSAGAQALASSGKQADALASGAIEQRSAIDDLMKQSNEVLARLTASAA
jgi:hypothetical protein